jgi:hypothetical protein
MRKRIARGLDLSPSSALLILAFGAAVWLRLAGIQWGLPGIFNADEPHLVNTAVSFGGGSLRPYDFKYPTLWPYLLFISYGFYFVVWSALGLRHHLYEFVGLFGRRPGGFYLIGRLFAAALSLAGAWFISRLERSWRSRTIPWAALLLAFAPVVNDMAHSCKPDCLMFFLACLAWSSAARVLSEGSRREHWLCGLFIGLAVSTHYTSAPLAALLAAANLLSDKKTKVRWLLEGTVVSAAAFFLASPYILIDHARFLASMKDFADLARMTSYDAGHLRRRVLLNLWDFAEPGSIAGLLACLGWLRLAVKQRRLAAFFLIPIALQWWAVSSNPDGSWERYLLPVFPGLALLAGEAFDWTAAYRRPLLTTLVAVLALAPGILRCAFYDYVIRLPDTRQQAESWFKSNVAPGATILLDVPTAEPNLDMTKEEVLELADKTRAMGAVRWKLYAGMAATHPGGGYRLYRFRRSPLEMYSGPRQVEQTQAETPTLDVRPGIDIARAMHVEYVVTSTYGVQPERAPELAAFFGELYSQAELVRDFVPVSGETAGPILRVFKLGR